MADEGNPAGPFGSPAPRTDDDPIESAAQAPGPDPAPPAVRAAGTASAGATASAASAASTAASATAATASAATTAATAAWSKLDRTSQWIAGGSIAVIALTILGLPFGVWGATDFVLIMLVAAIVAGAAAYLGTGSLKSMAIPLPVIELAAGAVIGVLAVWNAVEILFDLDQDDRGGVIGWIFTAGLAVAGVAVLVGALQRNGGPRAVLTSGDTWARVALIGLGLVLLGWALNLSGYWQISQAALILAVLTLAAVIVVVSRQIDVPLPAAWAGVVLAVFGAVLGIGTWSDLMRLGRTQLELDFMDYLGLGVATLGTILIGLGGVMTALDQQAKKSAIAAGPPGDDGTVARDEASPAG